MGGFFAFLIFRMHPNSVLQLCLVYFFFKIGSEALAGLELVSQTDFDILAIILSYLPKGGCDFRNRPMCLA